MNRLRLEAGNEAGAALLFDRKNEIEKMFEGAARDEAMRAADDPLVEILDAEGKAIDRLPRSGVVR